MKHKTANKQEEEASKAQMNNKEAGEKLQNAEGKY